MQPPESGKGGVQLRTSSSSLRTSPDGDTPRTHVAEDGNKLLKAHLPEDALILVEGFLRLEPDNVELNRTRGKALFELARFSEARAALEIVRAKAPSAFVDAHIAQCYVRECQPEKALEAADADDGLALQARRGILAKSQALRHLGRPEEAEVLALSLVSVGQTEVPSAEEFIEYGLTLHDQKDYAEALPYLRLAGTHDMDGDLVVRPKSESGRFAVDVAVLPLARALYVEGHHKESIARHPAEAVCNQPRLSRFVAGSLAEMGRHADAELMARVALSEEPGDAKLSMLLKQMLAAQGVTTDDAQARLDALRPKSAAERLLVAMASRKNPNDQNWLFVLAFADYHGAEAALPYYNAYYANHPDGSYALRLGEKLVNWDRLAREGSDPFDYKFIQGTALGATMLQNAPSEFSGKRGAARAVDMRKRLQALRANSACVTACLTAAGAGTAALPNDFSVAVKKGLQNHRALPHMRLYMGRAFQELPLPTKTQLGDYYLAMGQAHGYDNDIEGLRTYLSLAMTKGFTNPRVMDYAAEVLARVNGAKPVTLTIKTKG